MIQTTFQRKMLQRKGCRLEHYFKPTGQRWCSIHWTWHEFKNRKCACPRHLRSKW